MYVDLYTNGHSFVLFKNTLKFRSLQLTEE